MMAIPVDDVGIIAGTGVEVDHVNVTEDITEGDLDLEIETITDIVIEDKAGTMSMKVEAGTMSTKVEAEDFLRRVKVTVNKTGKIPEVENFNLWDF